MLHLNESIKQQLINEGIRTFPDECCGFLLGFDKNEDRVIEKILVVNNAKEGDKRRRFEITPQDYLAAENYADKENLTLIGIYHSHPNHPSIPSEHDRIVAQPFFSYIIVSIFESEFNSIQSWQLNDNFQFEEEQIIHNS